MKGTVRILKSYEHLSELAALHVKRFVTPSFVSTICFPTGGTPEGMYKVLREDKRLKWKNVHSFNLDEYKLPDSSNPEQYPYSYRTYMNDNLFSHIDIRKDKTFFPTDENYDSLIDYHSGIDMCILGIGTNGHIAFNEPGSSFDSKTRLVDLDKQTIEDNSRYFDSIDDVPTQAWTMGLNTIMKARQIYLLAQGKKKWEIIQKAFFGEITEEIPASILQNHDNFTVLYCE